VEEFQTSSADDCQNVYYERGAFILGRLIH